MADAPERTDLFAFKTTDAIRAVGRFIDLEVDGTLILALTAESARFLVYRHPEQAGLVEKPQDRSQRAGRPTEGPHDKDHPGQKSGENGHLPSEKKPQARPDRSGEEGQGNPRFQGSCRTNPLTKPGLSAPEFIEDEERQENDQDKKGQIFAVGQNLRDLEFPGRDLMDELLEQAEGTEPAARDSADEASHGGQAPDDVEAEFNAGQG